VYDGKAVCSVFSCGIRKNPARKMERRLIWERGYILFMFFFKIPVLLLDSGLSSVSCTVIGYVMCRETVHNATKLVKEK